MLHIVLHQPLIPQNTGNIGRLCAVTRSRLHLVHPLGFRITDAKLRRSGLDYWFDLDVHHHADWAAFRASPARPERLWLLETGSGTSYWDVEYKDGDGLVFGSETTGVPDWIWDDVGRDRAVSIPHANPELRSLNLSTSAGVALYEALRQVRPFPA